MSHYSASTEETGGASDNDTVPRSFDSFSSGPGSHKRLNSSGKSSLERNIRYVNSAAFIERLMYVNTSDSQGGSAPSSSVPSLDLRSVDGSSNSCPSTYHKHFRKPVNLVPNQAYENWLLAKSKLQSEKVAQRRREEQLKVKVTKERKRLAEEQYQQWLERKSHSTTVTTVQSKASNKGRSINQDEARLKVSEWEYKKQCEEHSRWQKKRLEEQRCREMAKERRMKAEAAWQHWSKAAANRPKPVPLNRGLITLKGTTSEMFVNPNEWQDINAGDDKN